MREIGKGFLYAVAVLFFSVAWLGTDPALVREMLQISALFAIAGGVA